MRRVLCCFLLLLFILPLRAESVDRPDELLPNPTQEAQAEAIGRQLRCLVCQNESIEESRAPLAQDLRKIVRQQLIQGRSSTDIMAWMTKRYGDFIRLKPVFDAGTALLWLMPLLALGGAFLLARRLWTTRPTSPEPLTADEKTRLREILKKD